MLLVRPNASVWARFEQSGLSKGFSTFPDLKGALGNSVRRVEVCAAARRLVFAAPSVF